MANDNSSNVWLWGVIRRCCVHAIVGAIVAALIGALCVGLAGAAIGSVFILESNSIFQSDAVTIFGLTIQLTLVKAGGVLGLIYGSITGGVIGFFGYAVVGIVAPPSRSLLPAKIVIISMLKLMGAATALALSCFLIWCAIFGAFRQGFTEAVGDGLLYAMFGVPALMAIGQIAGIWSGTTKLGKRDASPVSSER